MNHYNRVIRFGPWVVWFLTGMSGWFYHFKRADGYRVIHIPVGFGIIGIERRAHDTV